MSFINIIDHRYCLFSNGRNVGNNLHHWICGWISMVDLRLHNEYISLLWNIKKTFIWLKYTCFVCKLQIAASQNSVCFLFNASSCLLISIEIACHSLRRAISSCRAAIFNSLYRSWTLFRFTVGGGGVDGSVLNAKANGDNRSFGADVDSGDEANSSFWICASALLDSA